MPRIPTYDSPQVRSRPLGAPRLSSVGSSGLEAVGAGLQQAGGVMNQVAERAHAQAAAADATNGETELEQVHTRIFFDADTGLFHKKNKDAFAAEAPAFETLAKERERIARGLGSDRAREIFTLRAQRSEAGLRRQTENYLAREAEAALQESSRGRIAVGEDTIAQGAWADTKAVEDQAGMMASAAMALATTPEGQAAAKNDALQRAYSTAINMRLANGDAQGAQELLATHGDKLGVQASALRKRVQVELQAGQAAREAAALIDGARDEQGRVDGAKVMAQLDAGVAPPVRELALERLKLADESMKRQSDARYNELVALHERVGTVNHPGIRGLKEWFLDPANGATERWTSFERGLAAEGRAARRSGVEERRLQATLNAEALTGFRALDPEDQVAADIDGAYADADRTTRNKIREFQKVSRQRAEKGLQVDDQEFSRSLDAEAQRAGVPKDNLKAFRSKMTAWRLKKLQENNGKDATRSEFLEELGVQLLQGDYGALGRDRYRFQVSDDELGDFEAWADGEQPSPLNRPAAGGAAAPAPAAEAVEAEIREAFRRRGNQNPTPEQISAARAAHGASK